MNRDPLLYGVVGALIGGVVVWFLSINAINNNMVGMMRMMGMNPRVEVREMMKEEEEETPARHMEEMMEPLRGKIGGTFDKEFVNLMIVHHQGAIEMASQAKEKAQHDQLKMMADDIISAQSQEVEKMKKWQKDWGY